MMLAAAALFAQPAAAQTVEEIVARNLEAKGGIERLKAVNSIRQTSRMSMPSQGAEAPVLVLSKRPNLLRQEVTISPNTKVVSGFDGKSAWVSNPLVSPGGAPMQMSGQDAEIQREQSNFDPPFIDYKQRGYKIELVGTETLNDRKVYHLRVLSPVRAMSRPHTQHAYIDAETGLETKLVTETENAKFEQELLDWRDVNGIKVPFQIRMLVNGVLQSENRVEKVELNVPIDDALFMMPKR
jgi:hypothetical protein